MGIIRSEQLNWRRKGDEFSLHYEGRAKALLHVVPDEIYRGMWRVRFAGGSLSDLANLSWAKDAGRAHGLAALNRKRHQETALEGTYSDLYGAAA